MRWLKIGAICCVLSGVALPVPLAAEDNGSAGPEEGSQRGHRWALLIGVNDYATINDLYYCGRDIMALRDRLLAAGFPPDNVTLLHDSGKDPKHQPLWGNIRRELDSLDDVLGPKDLIVVAFSGHGVHLGGVSYLCPTGARFDKPTKTMISLETVYRRLSACPARQKLLLVDACRNDPRPGGKKTITKPTKGLNDFSRSLETPPEGILVLTSCKPGQVSVEDENLRHGVFMHYVLRGFEGQADRDGGDRNGQISLLELFNYANTRTRTYVARTRNLVQTPMLRGEITGDYEIAVAPPPVIRAEAVPSVLRGNTQYLQGPMVRGVVAAGNPQALLALQEACDLLLSNPYSATSGIPRSKCDKAIAACQKAISLESENAFAYYFRGLAYRKMGHFAKAMADFQMLDMPMQVEMKGDRETKKVEMQSDGEVTGTVYPGDKLNVTKVDGDRLWVDSVEGAEDTHGWIPKSHVKLQLRFHTESPDQVVSSIVYGSSLSDLTADDPKALRAIKQARDILDSLRRAGKKLSVAECHKAVAACNEAIRLEPDNECAYLLRGMAYELVGDFQKAMADFRKLGIAMPVEVKHSYPKRPIELKIGGKVVGTLESRDDLNVTKVDGNWLWVESSSGYRDSERRFSDTRGWIHKQHVEAPFK